MARTVMPSSDEDGTSSVPVCAWDNDNTATHVAFLTRAFAKQYSESVDLNSAAEQVLQVRDEARQPIG
ncbi:hypothetical protein [Streptomyces sp. NPDC058572]|uniref:hypothetical protein n=1 Tax=Streptomyces sp. NPDC058572 TaxID=3346546 RepID=UPI003655BA0A